MDLRNIAIIAHVDHGKTTLVDGLLKQSGTLKDNRGGDANERVMDFNDQEKERGITITAKNTAVTWRGTRINIVDTPGHSDFGSEVERVLRMVDGVLLLVDAAEGPMPQTRFVLRKSLELGLKALVCINKIDRKDARPKEVLDEVFDLFVSLGANDEQLDFPVIYAVGREGWAVNELGQTSTDLVPMFQFILDHVPLPTSDPALPLQMQVGLLMHSPFLGRIAVGRIYAGQIKRGQQAVVCRPDGSREQFRVSQLMTFKGLERIDCDEASAGDIIALAGAGDATVGDTICLAATPVPMPAIAIDAPTLSMTFSPNNSPFGGREGKFVTSRQIRDRLDRELLSNVGLKIEPGSSLEQFVVSGRGTLHLSVLIETMRREGFELSVSPPQVITRINEEGKIEEPIEEVAIDCAEAYSGVGHREAQPARRRAARPAVEPRRPRAHALVLPVAGPHRLPLRVPDGHARHRHHHASVQPLRREQGPGPYAQERRDHRAGRWRDHHLLAQHVAGARPALRAPAAAGLPRTDHRPARA